MGVTIVAMTVGLFLSSRPKRGTVEYHKQKYLAANDVRWKHRWEGVRSGIMGEDKRGVPVDFVGEKYHQAALLRLGYLEQREFVISNRPLDSVMSHVAGWVRSPNEKFYRYTTPATNRVVIVAVRDDMSKIAEVVRGTDVPE